MPIVGLTDGTPSFMEVGRIRKGAKGERGEPIDLDYFRADFRRGYEHLADLFATSFGPQPKSFIARLAFDQVELSWDANFEVYNSRGMLGRADGKRWEYLRSNKTGRILVQNFEVLEVVDSNLATAVNDEGAVYAPFDKNEPVYSYKSNKGEDVAVYAKPVGKLKLVVPALGVLAYVTLMTGSYYDVVNISNEIAAISAVSKQVGINLSSQLLRIERRWDDVSTTIGGQKQKSKRNLIHIQVIPEIASMIETYISGANKSMLTLDGGKVIDLPELPAHLEDESLPEENGSGSNELENVIDLANDPAPPNFIEPTTVTVSTSTAVTTPNPSLLPETPGKTTPTKLIKDLSADDLSKQFEVTEMWRLGVQLWGSHWNEVRPNIIKYHTTPEAGYDEARVVFWMKDRMASIQDLDKLKEHVQKTWKWFSDGHWQEFILAISDKATLAPSKFDPLEFIRGVDSVEKNEVFDPSHIEEMTTDPDIRGHIISIILGSLSPL